MTGNRQVRLIAEDGGERQHRYRLVKAFENSAGPIRVSTAYVTDRELLSCEGGRDVRLLTSISSMDIVSGATSLDALRLLVKCGVKCRGICDGPRLHAKVYIFGETAAFVTSANLTQRALDSNIEVGVEVVDSTVRALIAWFETQWQRAFPIDESRIDVWEKQTSHLKREFAALKRKATARLKAPPAVPPNRETARQSSHLRDLLANANRRSRSSRQSFLCNTDRTNSDRTIDRGFELEAAMGRRGFAAAWEPFRYPEHMSKARPGDLVFMYANGTGIVGVGEAQRSCEIRPTGAPDRVRVYPTTEWRIPVTWLFWDPVNPLPWELKRYPTFLDISAPRYVHQRERLAVSLYS